jgi:hypothetical protein
MNLILIIFLIILAQYLIINNKNNMSNISDKKINFITKENRCKNNKKFKTFVSRPIQYDCIDNKEFETYEDKFIDEYVFKSKLFCKNISENNPKKYAKKDLAEYRDAFFNFRNKTNISTNLITPIDNINEMRLLNPDLSGENISDIYDKLVSNKQNLLYNI